MRFSKCSAGSGLDKLIGQKVGILDEKNSHYMRSNKIATTYVFAKIGKTPQK
jgi:hypothetical protein